VIPLYMASTENSVSLIARRDTPASQEEPESSQLRESHLIWLPRGVGRSSQYYLIRIDEQCNAARSLRDRMRVRCNYSLELLLYK